MKVYVKFVICPLSFQQIRPRLVWQLKHIFSIFKKYYTYFYIFFYLHIFSNNKTDIFNCIEKKKQSQFLYAYKIYSLLKRIYIVHVIPMQGQSSSCRTRPLGVEMTNDIKNKTKRTKKKKKAIRK